MAAACKEAASFKVSPERESVRGFFLCGGTDRKPLPNPEFAARGCAWMVGSSGAVRLLSVAIVEFRFPTQAWSAILLLLVSMVALWRGPLLRAWARRRREQADASKSGSH